MNRDLFLATLAMDAQDRDAASDPGRRLASNGLEHWPTYIVRRGEHLLVSVEGKYVKAAALRAPDGTAAARIHAQENKAVFRLPITSLPSAATEVTLATFDVEIPMDRSVFDKTMLSRPVQTYRLASLVLPETPASISVYAVVPDHKRDERIKST